MTTPVREPSQPAPAAAVARASEGSAPEASLTVVDAAVADVAVADVAVADVAVADAVSAPPAQKPLPAWREKLKVLIAENGAIVLWVYFGIFFAVLIGFALAIQFGANVQGAAGTAGIWTAAYLATKLTQPLRIAATLVITPALASVLRRFRKRAPQPPVPPTQLR